MRERRSRMSSGSNFNLFHTLRDLSPKPLGLVSRPQYLSRTLSSAVSTLRHPSRMSCKAVVCRSVSSRLGRTSSTSRTTFERLLTLLNQTVRIRRSGCWDDSLVGDRLKLVRRINKLLPNLACKLVYGDKVAYAEAKAHRDLKYNAVTVASERKSYSEEKSLHPDCADIVAISLARPVRWGLMDTLLRRAKAAKVRQGPG